MEWVSEVANFAKGGDFCYQGDIWSCYGVWSGGGNGMAPNCTVAVQWNMQSEASRKKKKKTI